MSCVSFNLHVENVTHTSNSLYLV